jgi:hypothetical protein
MMTLLCVMLALYAFRRAARAITSRAQLPR